MWVATTERMIKMTEEQIIKVAEYCSSGEKCIGCVREHNIFQYASDCRYDLLKSLVIIANRQKSTIDELTKAYKTLKSEKEAEIARLKSENERILSNCRWCEENYVETAKKAIKSEVIEEFLDRAKKRIGDSHFQNYGLAIMEILDVAKEMEGDENG